MDSSIDVDQQRHNTHAELNNALSTGTNSYTTAESIFSLPIAVRQATSKRDNELRTIAEAGYPTFCIRTELIIAMKKPR